MKPLALVVENDAGTRRLLQVLLARAGFDCDCTASGSDGLLLAQNVHYDAYFFDLFVPGATGAQILGVLDDDARQRASIVSAAPVAQLDRMQAEWPDVSIIRKPFDLEDVLHFAERKAAQRTPHVRTDAEEFCRRSVLAGAKAGVIVLRSGDIASAVVSYGYPEGYVETFFPVAVDVKYPICDVLRSGRAIWLDSMNGVEAAYPPAAPVFASNATRAAAAVPLVREKIVIGAAGWTFREPHRFADHEQRTFTDIAAVWSERLAGATVEEGRA
ncbi:MAG TPA: response regulator [Thermoanaerobaculia bacterium]|nr:response regulator [Thermoanaerobaculia bacterium]